MDNVEMLINTKSEELDNIEEFLYMLIRKDMENRKEIVNVDENSRCA